MCIYEFLLYQESLDMILYNNDGMLHFQSLGVAFYRGADYCVLVYDVNAQQLARGIPALQVTNLLVGDRSTRVS
jgi:GTPase SAR1 family protein